MNQCKRFPKEILAPLHWPTEARLQAKWLKSPQKAPRVRLYFLSSIKTPVVCRQKTKQLDIVKQVVVLKMTSYFKNNLLGISQGTDWFTTHFANTEFLWKPPIKNNPTSCPPYDEDDWLFCKLPVGVSQATSSSLQIRHKQQPLVWQISTVVWSPHC